MRTYLSLVKFSHTVFALPFALTGFFMGVQQTGQGISWTTFGLILVCMVTARNAAMAFNRYADRHIDALNPRTAKREIPAGVIPAQQALAFVIGNAIIFVVATYFINRLCLYLSPIALAVVLGYSYTKRFTALCHLVLGVGLGLAPVGAYLAVTGTFDWVPVMLGFTVLTWVAGFDIIYALQDEAFDKEKKLHSIPAAIGTVNSLWLSAILHFISAGLMVAIVFVGDFHWLFAIGAGLFCLFLTRQHLIVKPDDLSKVNLAFFTLNGIASVVFGALAISDILFIS